MLYSSAGTFRDAAVPFLEAGLDAGDAVLMVAPAPAVGGLRRTLGSAARAVEFHDSAQWYSQPTRAIAAYSAYIEGHSDASIRVLAEPGWDCRTAAEIGEWTRYESIVNQAF